MKQKKRGRQRTGEEIVVEKKSLEVEERREIGNGTGEGVIAEAEDSKLVEASEGVGSEDATKARALKEEPNDSALRALDALPLTVIEALVKSVEEPVVEVGFGLEREQ